MAEVGVRALKQNASAVVGAAAAGEAIVITDRGRPVALLSPLPGSVLDRLVTAGEARAATRAKVDLPPAVDIGRGLSEELLTMRDAERY